MDVSSTRQESVVVLRWGYCHWTWWIIQQARPFLRQKGVTFFEAESCPPQGSVRLLGTGERRDPVMCLSLSLHREGMSQPDATRTTLVRRLCAEYEVKT